MTDMEPVIYINGIRLTDAQAMTLRVALESFAADTTPPDSLGRDRHGRAMRVGYLTAIEGIRRAMGLLNELEKLP
jgi:hypothetical protein